MIEEIVYIFGCLSVFLSVGIWYELRRIRLALTSDNRKKIHGEAIISEVPQKK